MAATLIRLWRMLRAANDRGGGGTLDVARLITDASCAATIPPLLWMIGAVAWKGLLPMLLASSTVSLGLAGLASLVFALRELLR
ncbi:MAG: hypothetical protein EKK45_17085 [Curvibacter sp.]|nr:MAG: hypothetical protein EKK45_17085 [Curvibacter sp.]